MMMKAFLIVLKREIILWSLILLILYFKSEEVMLAIWMIKRWKAYKQERMVHRNGKCRRKGTK